MIDRETAGLIVGLTLIFAGVYLSAIGRVDATTAVALISTGAAIAGFGRVRGRDPEAVLYRAIRATRHLQPVVELDDDARHVIVYLTGEMPRGARKLFERYAKLLGYQLEVRRGSEVRLL